MPDRTVTVHMPTATLWVGCLIILCGVFGEVSTGKAITAKAIIYFGMCLNQFLMIDMLSKQRKFLLELREASVGGGGGHPPGGGLPDDPA